MTAFINTTYTKRRGYGHTMNVVWESGPDIESHFYE